MFNLVRRQTIHTLVSDFLEHLYFTVDRIVCVSCSKLFDILFDSNRGNISILLDTECNTCL